MNAFKIADYIEWNVSRILFNFFERKVAERVHPIEQNKKKKKKLAVKFWGVKMKRHPFGGHRTRTTILARSIHDTSERKMIKNNNKKYERQFRMDI